MQQLTPTQIVAELDKYIVGQEAAKRAVAVALRNRWRRQQLPPEIRSEIGPKNILMIGPTGVGKTEIARRLARLTGSPFVKVEATKYTEVGYVGRDVESMVRDLVDNAISIVYSEYREKVKEEAEKRAENRLIDVLLKSGDWEAELNSGSEEKNRKNRVRMRLRQLLRSGVLDDRMVEVTIEKKELPFFVSGMGLEQLDLDFQSWAERLFSSKRARRREITVAEARRLFFDEEVEALVDKDEIEAKAIELTENSGIIFIDEIDKIASTGSVHGPDVSREGVQRDLLPIVEGTTVKTRYGYVRTDHILFIAAGAFHRSKPSDLMPELQGRFPIRVELTDLTKDDFVRILTEPENALVKQYQALLRTENVELIFQQDAIELIAEFAYRVNQTTQNIGARRLYTVMERLLEEVSFNAPDNVRGEFVITSDYVRNKLSDIIKDEDLSRFIL
ncbi:ATP-dependent hsl protease ATP-binding subunit HslU [Thermogutta terrifontis]|uniref:ATP-dependent protease ATPase subunit HslU n=1 Tax=Thermogutta terrifontis TaxID=1331910 RepID=A0A286RGX7_9BACT|nr:ATP-dependent protease ATPase subunit HslU [Thermogutta terrifontis]ASV75219.1 ATP-dependent hsl protease ATP-binding subunit HslU [Thermogutta terrifontis]